MRVKPDMCSMATQAIDSGGLISRILVNNFCVICDIDLLFRKSCPQFSISDVGFRGVPGLSVPFDDKVPGYVLWRIAVLSQNMKPLGLGW